VLKFIFPEDPKYNFEDLLRDTCHFFGDLKPFEFIFRDDNNYIWPLNTPVLNFVDKLSKNNIL
jgi:hypothetical protein